MKLHANAALSLNKRRVLARRIVNEGWSLAEAAEAAETSERTAGRWARRYRAEARPAFTIAPRPPMRSTIAPRSAGSE